MKRKEVLKISTRMKGVKEEDVYSTVYRKINRIFAMKLAEKIANNTKITPNQLTFMPLFLYIITAILFYVHKQPYLIFGGVVFLLSYFMDQLNGSLARIKNMANDFGSWLDGISDTFGLTLVYFGATFGVYNISKDSFIWVFGFLAVTSYLYGNWVYINFRRLFHFSTDEIEKVLYLLLQLLPFLTKYTGYWLFFQFMVGYIVLP